ncbi:MAG: hypothetical protein AAFV62_02560, partial [Pseudomonadota bacterium]
MSGGGSFWPSFGPRSWLTRLSAALGTLALAGCDDGDTIDRVSRDVGFDNQMIMAMAKDGPIPVEVFGAPWDGIAAEDVAANLRMPNALPPEIRFQSVTPGTRPARDPSKLVLIFNGINPPDQTVSCTLPPDARETGAPRAEGFDVFAVFCGGSGAMGSGFLT